MVFMVLLQGTGWEVAKVRLSFLAVALWVPEGLPGQAAAPPALLWDEQEHPNGKTQINHHELWLLR